MGRLLVLPVDLVPLLLEPFADFVHLRLRQALLLGLELGLEVLYHFVLVVDVLLYFVEVLRRDAVVLFLGPVDWLGGPLGHRKNVFDGVADDEVLAGSESLHGLLVHARDGLLLVLAVVGVVAHRRQGAVAHRARLAVQELLRRGFAVAFEVAEGFGGAVLGVRLQSEAEVAGEVGVLS